MRILVVNPNTTDSMTAKIGAEAQRAAADGTEILAVNPRQGPASIEGYYDEAICLAGLLQVVEEHSHVDAIVLACFDDTGLDAVRCIANCPVVAIGEAAFHVASLLSNKFSVVTTLARSVPAIEHNLHRYGLSARCARVRSSEVAVLDLENDVGAARTKIDAEIERAIIEDRAEAIVLGCAGMTDLTASLTAQHRLPVLDGVACAVTLCEGLVRLGLKTSRLGGYAPPRQKENSRA